MEDLSNYRKSYDKSGIVRDINSREPDSSL
jgi:hypothetical protein